MAETPPRPQLKRRSFVALLTAALAAIGIRPQANGWSCPQCGRQAHYCCTDHTCTCWRHLPVGAWPLEWTADEEGLRCPYCGFEAHADYWLDREMAAVGR